MPKRRPGTRQLQLNADQCRVLADYEKEQVSDVARALMEEGKLITVETAKTLTAHVQQAERFEQTAAALSAETEG